MSPGSFGATTASRGMLRRFRAEPVDVADLHDVAAQLLPRLASARLHLGLVRRPGAGTVLHVEEDERVQRVPLADLADDMSRAGVPGTTAGITAALRSWVERRPVTDADAAASGIAVLDWADPAETAVGWSVVVVRGDLAVAWAPSPAARAAELHRVRSASTGRAHEVPLQLRVEGPLALLSHRTVPVLASAALVAPELVHQRISATGLTLPDMHVVVTPHRPVACAGPGVARRLAGETGEASVTLPWRALVDLPWL
ncbi:hypothetical protein E9549_18225 [Blastococcus sp. MG754426]|uniref:hypothetical protein n=1 Tax=unclassified Blastococcus TaxID=2619396 RepID=UPI001EF019FB|nr:MULTISPECIES: hypothetical protein [unclassified Blastococcus]MCF6509325.1 hypothetical protein [Blastococcus sp. MG754426]MCF6513873.1 hypothetical protein [Blastococcus sp. MG754427]MCF6736710.1 hypothetical protein [Blastococcus sp. KM273129]